MPVTKERVEKLARFGLGDYEARVYLALLDLGVTQARPVSTLSRVPTSKIYYVLEQLETKGLVTILPEHPKRYAPVPFADFLRRLRSEHEKAAEAIDRDIEAMASEFAVEANAQEETSGGFVLSRGRRAVHDRLVPLLASARKDAFLFLTRGSVLRLKHIRADLEAAARRGVRLRVMAPVEKSLAAPLADLARIATVRARDVADEPGRENVAIFVADGEQALLVHHNPDDAQAYQGRDLAIYADQEATVGAVRAILGAAWSQAVALETRLEVLEKGEPHAALLSALGVNERRLMRILDAIASWGVAEGIAVLDRRGRLAFASGDGARIMRALQGTRKAPHRRALRTGEAVRGDEVAVPREDGSRLTLAVNAVPLTGPEGVAGVVVTFSDVTERRATEAALAETRERLRLAARAAGDVVWDWTPEADALWWSEAYAREFGEEGPVSFDAWAERVHPDDRRRVIDGVEAWLAGREEQWLATYRYRRGDGAHVRVLDRGVALRADGGRPVRVVGLLTPLDLVARGRGEDVRLVPAPRLQ